MAFELLTAVAPPGGVQPNDYLPLVRLTPTPAIYKVPVPTPGVGSSLVVPSVKTAPHTFVLADAGTAVEGNSATALTFTVPTNASVPYPIGTTLLAMQVGIGPLTISGATGVTLKTSTTLTTRTQNSELTLRKRGTNDWVVSGDTT